MNFTLEIKNFPLPDALEHWWIATWLPQGLSSPWLELKIPYTGLMEIPSYEFRNADPRGVFAIETWGKYSIPGSQEWEWKQEAKVMTGLLKPREGEVVVYDFAQRGLSVPLILGGLAVTGIVLVAVLRR